MTIPTRGLAAVLAVTGCIAVMPVANAADRPTAPYLRIDAGYGWAPNAGQGNIFNGDTGFGGNFGSTAVVGGGVGTTLPASVGPVALRADLTGTWRPSLGGGTRTGTLPGGAPVATSVSASNVTALASLYGDIDIRPSVTPFVGFGLGVASNHVDDLTITTNGTAIARLNGATNTAFAWSLTTGASVAVAQNVALDLAYRFLDGGRMTTGTTQVSLVGPATRVSAPANRAELQVHEIVASLRYMF